MNVSHLQVTVTVRLDQLTVYRVNHLSKQVSRVIYLFAVGIQTVIRAGAVVRAISRVDIISRNMVATK